jgi:2-polyprenyl-6-hydroxyphenyl methylase/3-demethylubiquinone-9 3-methyltransferase
MAMKTSLNPREIDHFSKDSARWWDENGPFRPLHRLGSLRMRYIRDRLIAHFGLDADNLTPFKGLKILDVGCGGGLVCEPLTRLGADVTGIDADENAIGVAKRHATGSSLKIDYRSATAEELAEKKRSYSVILALEIVEHVADRDFFVQTCADLCRPGGLVIFSTLNRTPKSFALGIVAAEHVLRWVPRGTHDWKKFVRPSELAASARDAGLREKNVSGYGYNPLTQSFEFSDRYVAVNYFMTFEKTGRLKK